MKKTQPLEVIHNYSIPADTIFIEPNDGYELSLINTKYNFPLLYVEKLEQIKESSNGFTSFELVLDNTCKKSTIRVNTKIWKNWGKPYKVILINNGSKIIAHKSE